MIAGRRIAALAVVVPLLTLDPISGLAWGDRGHEIIGEIAAHYLTVDVRAKVDGLLAGDRSGLTRTTGLTDETTWADKFRDSDRDTDRIRYLHTRAWHYVDIEIDHPDLVAACFGNPTLAPGTRASEGPAQDCIVDKIVQFMHELRDVSTPTDERRLALQYLLHLVGDLHQPLHVADAQDHGGNDERVRWDGHAPGTLHHYWDTVFVPGGGSSAAAAERLIAGITPQSARRWSDGTVLDWTWETFDVGRRRAYGPVLEGAAVTLDDSYAHDAVDTVAVQLQRAGVRLARLLNEALR